MENFIALILALFVIFMLLFGMYNIGLTAENVRLYRKCLVEQQDKIHKEAVELCKERTKE